MASRTWTRTKADEEGGSHRFYRNTTDAWIIERRGTGSKVNPFYYQAAPTERHYWVGSADTIREMLDWIEVHQDEDFSALQAPSRRFARIAR